MFFIGLFISSRGPLNSCEECDPKVIVFSGILRMSRDEASRLSIKLAIDSGNSMGTLTIVR
ncbi:hypothetical protein NECAME_02050 [Necator americanus]|uniref:Uncharacterized protein n=1 Tax=Necator americanus TaxID=51031 RepID=W2TI55_NECAM|nr:hypothetical protein NECAME_02050 [Necator americanus]ETN81760.1 hypothetical protein NECAME_02050 [Necator americanus]